MNKLMDKTDTIAAISTPSGMGGIAVVRVSGKNAIEITSKLVVGSDSANRLINQQANTVKRYDIVDNDRFIDEVLISVFRQPHSFTGENVVEISCHGSVFIQQDILRLLIEKGCRLAKSGEFTQRSFFYGKLDLLQAEAVADLIAAQNDSAHYMAINQMRGGFSSELKTLRNKMLDFVSLIELELDFSEEDVEFANREELKILSNTITEKLCALSNSFKLGNALKNGIPVALVGETNVGKSTLLNVLLNDEKAIVSDIHGTTRDVIEDCINIEGTLFRFIDTAGIRKTKDTIETLGIEKTYQQIEKAAIVLWLIDGTKVSEHIEWLTEKILKKAENKKIILIFNKIDKLSVEELDILNELFAPFDCERIEISAKNKINTEKLQRALLNASQFVNLPNSKGSHNAEELNKMSNVGKQPYFPENQGSSIIVSNIRHYEALTMAISAMERVNEGLESAISNDLISQDIKEAMHHIGEITGQISTDEVLGNIFGKFCIGK